MVVGLCCGGCCELLVHGCDPPANHGEPFSLLGLPPEAFRPSLYNLDFPDSSGKPDIDHEFGMDSQSTLDRSTAGTRPASPPHHFMPAFVSRVTGTRQCPARYNRLNF